MSQNVVPPPDRASSPLLREGQTRLGQILSKFRIRTLRRLLDNLEQMGALELDRIYFPADTRRVERRLLIAGILSWRVAVASFLVLYVTSEPASLVLG